MNPLPPSDVRRQGDRLRRRNNVLAGVGAAVAVAVIVTPLAILGTRGDGDASPDPAPPAPTARTATIPDGIDITTGMAENESGEPVIATADGEGVAELVICDTPTLPADGVSDRLAANASGPEYSDARELRAYESVDEAQAAIEGLVDTLAECPTQDLDTTTWVNTITDGTLGEDSYNITTTYLENGEPTLGGIVRHVVRVGNAIFVSMSYSEAFPGPSFDRSVVQDAKKLEPIINGFACEFSELSCSSEGTGVVLGPDGVGQLRLGMTPEEVEATGEATSTQGSAHDGWPEGCEVVDFRLGLYDEATDQNGRVSPEQGLERIYATPDMTTQEGVGIGSTVAEVTTAYPDLGVVKPDDLVTVPASTTAVYSIMFAGKEVAWMTLELNEQDCEI